MFPIKTIKFEAWTARERGPRRWIALSFYIPDFQET